MCCNEADIKFNNMNTRKNKMVIEFTANLERNSKIIFDQKLFEFEKDLVIKKTNRKNVKIWEFDNSYDLKYKGVRIGLFYTVSYPIRFFKGDVNCMFQFNKNAFDDNELRTILERFFSKTIGQVSIKNVKHINSDYEHYGLISFIIDNSSSINSNIIKNVRERLEALKKTLLSDRIHIENESVRGIAMQITDIIEVYKLYGMNDYLNEEIENFSLVDLNYIISMTK